MENRLEADKLISQFKKFRYGVQCDPGYRLATVYETEQLLKAIRQNSASGSEARSDINVVVHVKHELVPSMELEAFRLKDGYLFDFGTLATFYRHSYQQFESLTDWDPSENFRISYKLGVPHYFSVCNDTRGVKLCLPLALLHACAEEDIDEIRELVMKSARIKGNIVQMNLVFITRADDVIPVQRQRNIDEDHPSTSSGQRTQDKHFSLGTSTVAGDDESEVANAAARGLALLHCGTPWFNGGTALHFCAWAGKIHAALTLLELEADLVADDQGLDNTTTVFLWMEHYNSTIRIAKNSKLLGCQDNEGNIALSWAAVVPAKHIIESQLQLRIMRVLVWIAKETGQRQLLRHANLFGYSSILLAAKEGPLENFRFLFSELVAEDGSSLSTDSVRETHPHLFDQLEGNSCVHYLVLRTHDSGVKEIIETLERDRKSCTLLMWCGNHLGLTAFQAALIRGCSEICEWALRRGESGYVPSAAEFASRGLAIRDAGQGRNILHQYAEGGASKEVGRLILARLREAEAQPKDQSLPIFDRRVKEVGTIKEMIKELNVQGETPCIVALRRGHSDAFEMLLRCWGEELALHYLHPRTRDNILHCYAQSANPGVSNWHLAFIAKSSFQPIMRKLLSAKNEEGLTPLMCALYQGQTEAFCWLFEQEAQYVDTAALEHRNLLHVFAYHFRGEQHARDLLLQMEIELAIGKGNERTRDALLGVEGMDTSDTCTALLHALCKRKIQDPQRMWEKLTLIRCADGPDKVKIINPRLYQETYHQTPLMTALRAGNMKACEWLLAGTNGDAVVDAGDRGECLEVLNSFAEGDCKDKDVWDKLKKAYNLTPEKHTETTPHNNIASEAMGYINFYGEKPGEACALIFLRDPDLGAEICYKCLHWMSATSMKSFKVLAHIRRHKHYCHILMQKSILREAAIYECFELFDMALQAQTHQDLQQQYCDEDQYQYLFATIISQNPISSSNCFLQLLSMTITLQDKFIISQTRYMDLARKDESELLSSPRALLWAAVHLAAVPQESAGARDGRNSTNVLQQEGGGGLTRPVLMEWMMKQFEFEHLKPRAEYLKSESPALAAKLGEPESLALAKLLGRPSHVLRSIKMDAPKLVALLLQLITCNTTATTHSDPLPDELLRHSCNGRLLVDKFFSLKGYNTGNIHAVLNHFLHKKAISYSDFKQILAPASWTGQKYKSSTVEHNIMQQRTVLHQIAFCSNENRRIHNSMESLILLLHYFRFFQIEDTRDHRGATALHLTCMSPANYRLFPNYSTANLQEAAFTLLTICPHLAALPRRSGRTALHDSAFYGYPEIVEHILLLKGRNALLDERDADGRTALHFAAASESDEPIAIAIVRLVLEHAKLKEKGGYAALLLWASAAGHAIGTADKVAKHPSVATLLREEMAKETQNIGLGSKINLLELAVSKRSDIMTRELINRGADTIRPEFLEGIELHGTKESDQPANRDSLGRAPLAKAIAALLLNPFTAVPITIGVFGPWGMGKSSVMLQSEIALIMTMIERNLLPKSLQGGEELPGHEQKEVITMKGKEVHHNILTAFRHLTQEDSHAVAQGHAAAQNTKELNQNTRTTGTQPNSITTKIKLLYKRLQTGFLNCWTESHERKTRNTDNLQEFVSSYTPKLRPLYKGLALMDRNDLFQQQSTAVERKNVGKFPSCITIHYNAWLYYGEKEASSGLAFTIMKELEECLNTSQWLRLCWRYAYRSDPLFIFSNITLPFIVFVGMGSWVLWIMWKLLSLPSIANNEALKDFRYGSLPIAVVISTWIILRTVVNIVKPVSEQVIKSLHTKTLYEEKLGYHQQIIDDIEFFKEELTSEPGFGWKFLSQIWNILVENRDNIPFTNIKKSLLQKKNSRIIVFVDDLDRCTESTYILQLLGAINLILSVCSINVIIGMDKDMVEEVLKSAYQDKIEAAQQFLEKIIQLPVYLNEASEQEMSTFMREQLIGKFKSNAFSTTQMHMPKERTLHEGYSNERQISIVTEEEYLQGQRNDNILNRDTLPNASNALEPGLENQRQGDNHEGIFEGHEKLTIQFQFLVSNYTRTELTTFKYLQSKAKSSHRQPRNWKRLLNYHRLAWYIISQTKSETLKYFYGWQEQLIVWVFICYNWKSEMNEIFKDWKDLLKGITQKNEKELTTLYQLIELHIEKIEKRKEITQSIEEWENLRDTLFGTYDIDVRVGVLFQNYRFHCATTQLELED